MDDQPDITSAQREPTHLCSTSNRLHEFKYSPLRVVPVLANCLHVTYYSGSIEIEPSYATVVLKQLIQQHAMLFIDFTC